MVYGELVVPTKAQAPLLKLSAWPVWNLVPKHGR